MNGIGSLTRTLPVLPTRFFTPEAMEMPPDAFTANYTTNDF